MHMGAGPGLEQDRSAAGLQALYERLAALLIVTRGRGY